MQLLIQHIFTKIAGFFIFICLKCSVISLERHALEIKTNLFPLCIFGQNQNISLSLVNMCSFWPEVYMKRQPLSGHAVSQLLHSLTLNLCGN